LARAHSQGRWVAYVALRATGIVLLSLALYTAAPVQPETSAIMGLSATLGLTLVCAIFARQVGRIGRSDRPVFAAIEALSLVASLFITLFAFLYVSISTSDPSAFTQPIGKLAGIYFAVTTLATVGFGDIAAASNPARVAVTAQMVLDLVLLGVAVKVLGSSARRALEARDSEQSQRDDVRLSKNSRAPGPPDTDSHGVK
jgi:hypothetical protein